MLHFFILISILLIFGLLFNNRNVKGKKHYVFLSMGLLATLAMFKSDIVGNDTMAYIDVYNQIAAGVSLQLLSGRFEFGFLILCKILSYITKNPQILFIVSGFYIFMCFGYIIYRFSLVPWLSTLIFFLLYFDMALSGLRHTLALATVAVSLVYIINNKPIRFIIVVLIAASFHKVALCFLLAYPLSKFDRYGKVWKINFVIIAALFIILFSSILHLILKLYPQYYYYASSTYIDGRVRYASLFNLLIAMSMYISAYHLDVVYKKKIQCLICDKKLLLPWIGYNTLSNLTFMSCIFIVISFPATILERFANLLGFFVVLYCPNMIALINHNRTKTIYIVMLIFILITYKITIYIVRPEWVSTYPYTFCTW